MQTTLEKFEKKLRLYTEEKQLSDILKIIRSEKEYLIKLNTSQLMEGKDIDGVLLEPPYFSPSYAEFKLLMNPLGVVDLFLTGKFQRSIFVNANEFPVIFDARDSKKDMLVAKYGKILGVSEEDKALFNEHILPKVKEYYLGIFSL